MSTQYLSKLVLSDGTWLVSVPSDPNGVLTAPAGSIAQAADGSGPWSNTTGAMVWTDVSGSVGPTFVYQPGGVAAGNVYTDFNVLYTAAIALAGPKVIQFDSTFGALTIPPRAGGGSYDFVDFTATLSTEFVATTISLDDGVTCDAFFSYAHYCAFQTNNTVVPVLTSAVYVRQRIVLDNSSISTIGGSLLFADFDGGLSILAIWLLNESSVASAAAVVANATNGAQVRVYAYTGSTVPADVFATDAGMGSAVQIRYDASSPVGLTQAAVLGVLQYLPKDLANRVAYTPAVGGDWPAPAPGNDGSALNVLAARATIASARGMYPSNVYTVDTTIGAADTLLRVYPTLAEALTAGLAAGLPYAVHLLPNQAGTVPATIDLSVPVTIKCAYGRASLAITAPMGLINGTGNTFTLENLSVFQAAGATVVDATGLDVVQFDDCTITSLGGQLWLGFAGAGQRNSRFIGTRFSTIGQTSAIGFNFVGGAWSPGAGFPGSSVVFGMSGSVVNSFYGMVLDVEGISDWTLFRRSLNAPVVSLEGVNIAVENLGVGAASLFDSASLGVKLRGVTVTRTGAGVINFGTGVAGAFPGLSWHGTDPNDALLPSGSWHNLAGAIVQVP